MLQAADIFLRLYHDIFIKHDATMIEINPMSESNDGTGTCLLLIDCVICYLLHTYLIFLKMILYFLMYISFISIYSLYHSSDVNYVFTQSLTGIILPLPLGR